MTGHDRIRVVIVEDEAPARRLLARLLARESDVDIVGSVATVDEALAMVKESSPDLVFLDIQLAGEDGFSLLDHLPASGRPYVIMVTAHNNFAGEAFDHAVSDYVLKPIDPHRLATAIARVRLQRRAARRTTGTIRLYEALISSTVHGSSPPRVSLQVRNKGESITLPASSIDYVASEDHYLRIVAAGKSYLVRGTLRELERRLPQAQFIRIHRTVLINTAAVGEIVGSAATGYDVVLRDGTKLPISRRRQQAVLNHVHQSS